MENQATYLPLKTVTQTVADILMVQRCLLKEEKHLKVGAAYLDIRAEQVEIELRLGHIKIVLGWTRLSTM